MDKLRALGYVAYRSPVPADVLASGLPDPKSKLAEFNSILEAEDALQRHNDDQADALLRKVQEQDPNIYVIPFLLGETAVRNEKWAEAADQLQRCLKLNPNFDNAVTGLARALGKLGHAEEAKGWLQKATSISPQNYRAWYETGLLDASRDPAAALSAYQKAVAVQPNFYPGQRELGMALFNRKDYLAAAPHLEKAISLGLEDAHLHNYLGICYSRTNRLERAVRSYRAALKLDPGLAEAHLNLAFALQRMQEPAAAETEYKAACKLEEKFCEFVPHR
jgi:tetratricopeptide (TPR) repeat protein